MCDRNGFRARLNGFIDEYQSAVEEFLAYGSVLLRLALVNLRTVQLVTRPEQSPVGRGHFCRALRVTVQIGLSHPLSVFRDGLAYSL